MIPLGVPGEIRRVYVGGEPLTKAVQLVRSYKMHLARKTGPVAEVFQIVRKGWNLGGELGRVIPGADLARQPTTHHDKA